MSSFIDKIGEAISHIYMENGSSDSLASAQLGVNVVTFWKWRKKIPVGDALGKAMDNAGVTILLPWENGETALSIKEHELKNTISTLTERIKELEAKNEDLKDKLISAISRADTIKELFLAQHSHVPRHLSLFGEMNKENEAV